MMTHIVNLHVVIVGFKALRQTSRIYSGGLLYGHPLLSVLGGGVGFGGGFRGTSNSFGLVKICQKLTYVIL